MKNLTLLISVAACAATLGLAGDASAQAAGLDPGDAADDRLPAPLRCRHLKEPPPHESHEFFEAGVVILEYPQRRGVESIEVQRRPSGGSGGSGRWGRADRRDLGSRWRTTSISCLRPTPGSASS